MIQFYLSHHGIKGQKWGIRRFQNDDGSLTKEGKRRYKVYLNENRLEQKRAKRDLKIYKKKGDLDKARDAGNRLESLKSERFKFSRGMKSKTLSERDKQKIFETEEKGLTTEEKKRRALKIAAAAAGVTVAAIATIYAVKAGRTYLDSVVKKGTTIQHLSDREVDLGDGRHMYGVHKKIDKMKYRGLFQGHIFKTKGYDATVYINQFGAKNDIKVLGKRSGQKAFSEMFEKDKAFRDSVRRYMPNITKKDYDRFNINLVSSNYDPEFKKNVSDRFYANIAKKGYGAVKDMNDMNYSGYNAAAPIIYFNKNRDLMKKSLSELPQGKDVGKAYALNFAESLLTPDTLATIGGGFAIKKFMDYKELDELDKAEKREAGIIKKGGSNK